MAVNWDEKYSVGIAVIDEQHKQFVHILDKLSTAVGKMESKAILGQIFNDLDNYVVYHFGTEEKYFKEFNYSGAKEHVAEHKRFIDRLTEMKEKQGRDELKISFELISFMADWLVNHVRDEDRKYIECFHEHGIY